MPSCQVPVNNQRERIARHCPEILAAHILAGNKASIYDNIAFRDSFFGENQQLFLSFLENLVRALGQVDQGEFLVAFLAQKNSCRGFLQLQAVENLLCGTLRR